MSKQKDEAIYRKGWDDGFAKGAAAARFQLEAENAKLRELVRDLWLQLLNAYDRKEVDEFADRMNELGVDA